ncbi:MAG: TRAP transporter substrate-binding protein DctP [Pseudomonadota bacterium]
MTTSNSLSLPRGFAARLPLLVTLVAWLTLAGPAHALTLKIATISPEGSVWMQALRTAGKRVAEETEGRVKLKFYPGGVQGDDKAVLRKMRVGSLHGGVMTVGILGQSYPDIQLYGLPLLFENNAQLDYVRGKMDAGLLAGLEDKGFVGFGIAEIGFALAMSQSPIRSVQDVQSQKFWVPDGDVGSAKALEAFGISPIPLTIGDVLGGLQTQLIDTIAAPPVGAITLQWHTRLDYVLDVPLLYTYGLLVVSKRHFDKIDEVDQTVVRDVLGAVTATVNERSRKDHDDALAVLKQQGLEFLSPPPEAMDAFRAQATRANEKLVDDGIVSRETWQAFLEHRAAAPGS